MFISTKRFRTISRISVVALLILLFVCNSGKSTTIQCERLERNYVNCEQRRSFFFGSWSDSPISFRLIGVELEEYAIEQGKGSWHSAYRLRLQTPDQQIEFYDYNTKFKQAEADQKRFLKLLSGSEATSFQLTQNFFGRDIFHTIGMLIFVTSITTKYPLIFVEILLAVLLALLQEIKISIERFLRRIDY
jgi:hypothetical protein